MENQIAHCRHEAFHRPNSAQICTTATNFLGGSQYFFENAFLYPSIKRICAPSSFFNRMFSSSGVLYPRTAFHHICLSRYTYKQLGNEKIHAPNKSSKWFERVARTILQTCCSFQNTADHELRQPSEARNKSAVIR